MGTNCQLITYSENYLSQICPVELAIPTWISSCLSGGTVSCALALTTNATISTSISHNHRSWVAIFHLSQPMAFLSHISHCMPGLAPLMNVLFLGLCKLLEQVYVMERLKSSLGKLYCRYNDLS